MPDPDDDDTGEFPVPTPSEPIKPMEGEDHVLSHPILVGAKALRDGDAG